MSEQTRSAVFAIKKEAIEGKLEQVTSPDNFTVLRDGFAFSSNVETLDTDELVNSIGATKSFLSKETPSGSIPKYFKHSGVEGQTPSYSPMIESAMGRVNINSTEYDTIVGSTVGDKQNKAVINVDVGEGVNFRVGQALLIKDNTNKYHIRNIDSISGDSLTLNFNLPVAPGASVQLGRAIHYEPTVKDHPTYSAHLYQAALNSAYHQAMAGCRTTSMEINFPANDFAEINFEFAGIDFFYNPIEITSSNNKIDFEDSGLNVVVATLEEKIYKTPIELAREISSKMTGAAVAADNISASFDSQTGRFEISSDGGSFSLLWSSGANSLESSGQTLGYAVLADDTGATSYIADNEQVYDSPVVPDFDDSDAIVVRSNEFLLGDHYRIDCRKGNNVSLTIATPKTDIDSFCADSGVSESLILEREVTLSATLFLQKHEVDEFDKFLNNKDISLMFNSGPKSGGNWVPGKSINVAIPCAAITTNVVADSDGIQVVNLEARAFVTSDKKDIHINLL